MAGLNPGDILELKEDVFLLRCFGGTLRTQTRNILPFSPAEWDNAPHPKKLGGWAEHVRGVIPKGTRLVFRPEAFEGTNGVRVKHQAQFVSGPMHGYDMVDIKYLIYAIANGQTFEGCTDRYLIKVNEH